jgi:hypothetical protein
MKRIKNALEAQDALSQSWLWKVLGLGMNREQWTETVRRPSACEMSLHYDQS